MSTVYHSQTGSIVLLPLAGADEENLSITVEEGILKVSLTTQQEERQCLFRERDQRTNYRFELKPNVNTELISAKLEHGLLTIHIPSNKTRKKIKILAA